jgi:transposase-like protein
LPYSEEELNKIKSQLLEKLSDFKQKELPENALALFIDAYHTEVKDRGKVKKILCICSFRIRLRW